MIHYNLDKLVTVTVNAFKQSERYCYKKELKVFGRLIRKAGIYDTVWNEYKGISMPNYTFILDVLCVNPCVVLRFVDGSEKRFYFGNHDRALDFAEDIRMQAGDNFIS